MIKRFNLRKLIEAKIEGYIDEDERKELDKSHRKCFKKGLFQVCYVQGTKFIFQGMLELSQLSACSLSIHVVQTEDVEILTAFIRKQLNSVSQLIKILALGEEKMAASFLKDSLPAWVRSQN